MITHLHTFILLWKYCLNHKLFNILHFLYSGVYSKTYMHSSSISVFFYIYYFESDNQMFYCTLWLNCWVVWSVDVMIILIISCLLPSKSNGTTYNKNTGKLEYILHFLWCNPVSFGFLMQSSLLFMPLLCIYRRSNILNLRRLSQHF